MKACMLIHGQVACLSSWICFHINGYVNQCSLITTYRVVFLPEEMWRFKVGRATLGVTQKLVMGSCLNTMYILSPITEDAAVPGIV